MTVLSYISGHDIHHFTRCLNSAYEEIYPTLFQLTYPLTTTIALQGLGYNLVNVEELRPNAIHLGGPVTLYSCLCLKWRSYAARTHHYLVYHYKIFHFIMQIESYRAQIGFTLL